jgi:co-chaperonin GroES (HSP10)
MPIPKSDKLSKEESQEGPQEVKAPAALATADPTQEGPVRIREVQCLNDFVAVLQSSSQSSIAVPDQSSLYKNEGIVVGVGPGIGDGHGGRLEPTVKIGDVVMFGERNIAAMLESDKPPYAGHRVVIVAERNLLCKLPHKIDWIPYAQV